MPFFTKARLTKVDTSLSHPGSISSRPSSSVTEDPRSLSSESNSLPIAPPPFTATRSGISSIYKNSSLVTINFLSISNP